MTQSTIHPVEFSAPAIFGRLINVDSADGLSVELARHILTLKMAPRDDQRLDELLPKAQAGTLTESEREELENLNHIADLLSLWHSKARRAMHNGSQQ